ncbi:hypothetical protein EJ02DRAFT_456974 [Clathrospora elynae]|uniref:Uncharacterized protein n=1 Tax=Clathrospora elynae TaxID=706981 RepID=A0A6A5SLF7_9PLEO|nr:hypothetical protein EJ02DRAFT_456974 [Clathrospora elynae]
MHVIGAKVGTPGLDRLKLDSRKGNTHGRVPRHSRCFVSGVWQAFCVRLDRSMGAKQATILYRTNEAGKQLKHKYARNRNDILRLYLLHREGVVNHARTGLSRMRAWREGVVGCVIAVTVTSLAQGASQSWVTKEACSVSGGDGEDPGNERRSV